MSMVRKVSKRVFTSLVFVIIILSLSISVSALSVNELKFSWHGADVKYVAYNQRIPTNIEFNITFETNDPIPSRIVVDVSDMNNDERINSGYENIEILLSDCANEGNLYSCELEDKIIRVNKKKIDVGFTFYYADGGSEEKSLSHEFLIDNTKPVISFFGPETCHEGTCYVIGSKTNRIKIKMDDATATFNRKYIAFSAGGDTGLVSECEGTTCYGYITPICSDNQVIPLRIAPYAGVPSQDDAGNTLTGTTSTSIKCDTQLPIIREKIATSTGQFNAITSNDELIITLNATDSISPTLNMTVIGEPIVSENVSASCLKVEGKDYFTCSVVMPIGAENPGDYTVPVIVSDLAGNKIQDFVTFKLLSSVENKIIDLWSVKKVDNYNKRIAKENMIYERTIYLSVELKPKATSSTEFLQVTTADTCIPYKENQTGNKDDIRELSVVKSVPEKNMLYLKAVVANFGDYENDRYEGMSRLQYHCPLKIISKTNSYVYSTPEDENFTLIIDIDSDNTMDQLLRSEIEKTERDMQGNRDFLKMTKGVYQIAEGACRILAMGEGAASALGAGLFALENAARLLGPLDGGVVKTQAMQMGQTVDGYHDSIQQLGQQVGVICQFFTCNGSSGVMGNINDMWDSAADDYGLNEFTASIGGPEKMSQALNPYKSEPIAYLSLCLPAIVYHQQVRLGMECDYYGCLTDGVANRGMGVSSCQDQYAYNYCVYTSGNILDAIPITAVFRQLTSQIVSIAKDPITLFGSGGIALACRLEIPIIGDKGLCHTLTGATASLTQIQRVQAMLYPQTNPEEECDKIIDKVDPRTKVYFDREKAPERIIKPNGETFIREYSVEGTNYKMNCQVGGRCNIEGTNIWLQTANPDSWTQETIDPWKEVQVYQGNKYMGTAESIINRPFTEEYKGKYKIQKPTEKDAKPEEVNTDDPNYYITKYSKVGGETFTSGEKKETTEEIKGDIADILVLGNDGKLSEGKVAAMIQMISGTHKSSQEDYKILTTQYTGGEKVITAIKEYRDLVNKQAQETVEVQNYLNKYKEYLKAYLNIEKNQKLYDGLKIQNDILKNSIQTELDSGKSKTISDLNAEYGPWLKENNLPAPWETTNTQLIDLSNPQTRAIYEIIQKKLTDQSIKTKSEVESKYKEAFNENQNAFKKVSAELDANKKTLSSKEYGDMSLNDVNKRLQKLVNDYGEDALKGLSTNEINELLKEYGEEREALKLETSKPKGETAKEKAEKKVTETIEDIEDNRLWEFYYGDLGKTWRSFLSMGTGIASFRDTLGLDFGNWGGSWMDTFIASLGDVANIEREWCKGTLTNSISSDSNSYVGSMRGSGIFNTGAMVNARRSTLVAPPDKDSYYEYWIAGGVSRPIKDDLRFKILLEGPAGTKDLTRDLTGASTGIVNRGGQVAFGGTKGTFNFQDAGLYDRVCIDFMMSGSELRQYFDQVIGMGSGRFCQSIVGE